MTVHFPLQGHVRHVPVTLSQINEGWANNFKWLPEAKVGNLAFPRLHRFRAHARRWTKALWKYKAVYQQADECVGQWSNVVSIPVTG
jgi:hypothetical protein